MHMGTRIACLVLALSLAVPAAAQSWVIVAGSRVDPEVTSCGSDDRCVRGVLEGRGRLTVEEAMRLFAVYQRMGDSAAACRLANVIVRSPAIPTPEQLIARQYVSLSCH
jgi:hypothetical protein